MKTHTDLRAEGRRLDRIERAITFGLGCSMFASGIVNLIYGIAVGSPLCIGLGVLNVGLVVVFKLFGK